VTGKYGSVAAKAIRERLEETGRYDVLPDEAVHRAITTLGLTSPLRSLVEMERVGTEAFGASNAVYQGGGVIVSGEIVDYGLDPAPGGRRAHLRLRVVAYDVTSMFPVNGAFEVGVSPVRTERVTDGDLTAEALRQAAGAVVRTMRGQRAPEAKIVAIRSRSATIDRGAREGFRTGDTVVVCRGPVQIATARVGRVEPDSAEINYERVIMGILPGYRVRGIFPLPPLPPAATPIRKGERP